MKKAVIVYTFIFCLGVLCVLACENQDWQRPPGLNCNLSYRALQPGEVVKVILKASPNVQKAQIQFSDVKYPMGQHENSCEFMSLVGLDLGMKPGVREIEITAFYKDGTTERIKKEIYVINKQFPLKKLWVDEKFVTPPQKVQERIRVESELLGVIYDIFTPQWLGDGPFIIPTIGKAWPNFGERRIFNGKPRSSHSGVDISSPFGSPVKASNSGRVVLANNLYFAGNTVIIDHGLGVFTLYCHFSKIRTSRSAFVKKGDIIGEIGATGRVTGPHLHRGVKILGNRVDPFSLLDLDLK